MNVPALGNSYYRIIRNDAAAIAEIRTECAALGRAILTDPAASARVTSATVNGQTFTAQPLMTNIERYQILCWVVACCDNGGPISSFQVPQFP